jgi:hypothetical protein
VAEQLPSQLGAGLLVSARESFAQAFEVAAAISAVISLATAIVAVLLLRRVRTGEHEGQLDAEQVVANPA